MQSSVEIQTASFSQLKTDLDFSRNGATFTDILKLISPSMVIVKKTYNTGKQFSVRRWKKLLAVLFYNK